MSCCTWTCVCTAISNGMDIPEMPGYHLLRVFSEGHNNYSKDWCLMNSQPTFSIFAFDLMTWPHYQRHEWKPDNFGLHYSLKRCFANIRGLRSNFVWYESFLESNSPKILAVCEPNLDDWIDSGIISILIYLPLIGKNCYSMHDLAVYVK